MMQYNQTCKKKKKEMCEIHKWKIEDIFIIETKALLSLALLLTVQWSFIFLTNI